MNLIKKIYKNHRKHILRHICLGIIGCLCTAAGVRVLQKLLDGLTSGSTPLWLLGVYAVLLIEPYIGAYLDNHPDQNLRHGIYFQLKTEALEKMRTVAYTSWQEFGMGTLIQRVEAGAEAGRDICCDFYINLISGLAPQIIITAVFIAFTDLRIFYWVLAGYVAVFIITNLLLKALYSVKNRILLSEEIFNHRLVRGFMELVVFRMYRRFGDEVKSAREEAAGIRSARVEMVMIHEAFFALFVILVGLLKLGVLGYAIHTDSLSVGAVVALMSYLDSAYQPIAIFNVCYVQYKLNLVAYKRLEDFMNSSDVPNMLTGKPAELTDGSVVFENAACDYNGRRVYDSLSLTIPSGSVTGFAGESGSGKSSILRQLTGLIPVAEGRITAGGCDISQICLEDYYRHIAYVPQEAPVFDGTLRENLVFGADIPDSELLKALDSAELTDLFKTLPDGLETQIGERGVTLSGGERQRLALARLYFLDDVKLVMLDESSSAMDNLTEERVLVRLLSQLKGKTVIMIAHRLDTLRAADRIILIKDGKLCGSGSYDELARENEYFKELLTAQSA